MIFKESNFTLLSKGLLSHNGHAAKWRQIKRNRLANVFRFVGSVTLYHVPQLPVPMVVLNLSKRLFACPGQQGF